MKKLGLPADLVFVKGKESIFSRLIRWFTRAPGESKTYANHVAGIVEDSNNEDTKICEALWTVKITNLSRYSKKEYEIWRLNTISSEDRNRVVQDAKKYLGNIYGIMKIIFHALDYLIIKIIQREVFLFRRLIVSNRYPICSWLWAWAYHDIINYKFGIEPKYASPDDMHDFVKKSDDWILVYKNK